MNKIKLNYEAPAAQAFVVGFEGNLCVSGPYGAKGAAGQQMVDDDDYTYSL